MFVLFCHGRFLDYDMRVIVLVVHRIWLVVIKWFVIKNKHLPQTGINLIISVQYWYLSIMIEFRYGTLSKWLRYSYDGIRQLSTLDYSIAHMEARPLYTHILVNFTRLATKTIDHLLNDVPPNQWKWRWLEFRFCRSMNTRMINKEQKCCMVHHQSDRCLVEYAIRNSNHNQTIEKQNLDLILLISCFNCFII